MTGGAALGIAGGIQDVKWLLQQQKETRSYAVDMYNFNLGNIQALPYSLTKTGTLTRNNKLFPVLEYYSCTDEEKDALINKINYDGMTVGKIDILANYMSATSTNFVKGELIRLETITDDFHIADAIYEEITKGVYMTSGIGE